MCAPAVVGLAIAAVQAGVTYVGQQQQAKAQGQAIAANAKQQQDTLTTQQWQARGNAAEQMSQRAQAATVERGRLIAASAETGLGGNLTDRFMNQSDFNTGQDITSIQRNAKNTSDQQQLQKQGAYTSSQGRLNTIEQPSLLGAGLQIAGAYANYQAKQVDPKDPTS